MQYTHLAILVKFALFYVLINIDFYLYLKHKSNVTLPLNKIISFITNKNKSIMNGHKITNQNHVHFITPTIVGWIDVFTRKVYKDIIIDSLKFCIKNKGLSVHAYVIMSNHLHLVVSAKEGFQLSNILRDFKRHTSKAIITEILTNSNESRQEWMLKLFKYFAKYNKNNTTHQLWKRDNHPAELPYNNWIKQKIDYIHINPVRAGIVETPEDYVYSSAKNYIRLEVGLLPLEMLEEDMYQ